MAPPDSRFLARQRAFFQDADTGHFAWQTRNPYIARTERALLAGFPVRPGDAVLEVGCGEGGNLVNVLGDAGASVPRMVVGVDLFAAKLAFAVAERVPGRFVCADALRLPFLDAAFDAILCRDLLHHVPDRGAALAELARVAKPGATVWIVEPNGRNPLIKLLALARPHERGQLETSVDSLTALVGRHFPQVTVEVRQPLPLYRLALHYQFGAPRLGAWRPVAAALDVSERCLAGVWPRRWWAYIVARAGPAR